MSDAIPQSPLATRRADAPRPKGRFAPEDRGCIELRVAQNLADHPNLVCLPGSREAGSRGRLGLVGLPTRVHALSPSATAVARAIDAKPPNCWRVVLLGYELGAPGVFLPAESAPRGQPTGLVCDLETALLVDHGRGTTQIWQSPKTDSTARERLEAALRATPPPLAPAANAAPALEPVVDDATHSQRIRACLEHIAAGDIYQANLSRRLRLTSPVAGLSLLAQLARHNPVAHSAYLRIQGQSHPFELVSNTMETLLTFDASTGTASSYPIKGTRGRHANPDADAQAARALAADPKERAEHVMIVDLVRNDLGKVCAPGSVWVPQLMGIEGYRGVWHGVSEVQGRLAANQSPGSLLESLFPGGSITGAPKRRAMEIIRELEAGPRGAYTGSIALVAPNGDISCSILIRTLVADAEGWSLNVGGGIVADSRPEREIQETWEKVSVFASRLARAAAC